ncbi:MAG TPA: PoNe immunity protein domain-containing protein [Noviherbaspirillum sp.]
MRRDVRGSEAYWNKWVDYSVGRIKTMREKSDEPGDDDYLPQYLFELAIRHLVLMLERYSRGDDVRDLSRHFDGLLEAWENAERLGRHVWNSETQFTRHSWAVNLDHYIDCFWLIGLALTLKIPDAEWQRLLILVGNEGEDTLLDRVIASRQPDRKIGGKLCFPKAYQRLLDVVEAPKADQSGKLRTFVEHWYPSLKNAGSPSFPPAYRTPYWYAYGDQNFQGGAYFGRWCIEAVAVATAFDIADTACLDHPNYPGDLRQDNRSPRYPDPESAVPPLQPPPSAAKRGWLSRLLGK